MSNTDHQDNGVNQGPPTPGDSLPSGFQEMTWQQFRQQARGLVATATLGVRGVARALAFMRPVRHATLSDERRAGDIEEVWYDPDEGCDRIDMGVERVEEEDPLAEESTPKTRVRRAAGRRFVSQWVAWGKAEFPGAYRSLAMADRICIEQRLCKEMRKRHIRDVDIARYKGRIVQGIMLPSPEEREDERLWASTRYGDLKRAGLPQKQSWLGWLSGRGGVQWTK